MTEFMEKSKIRKMIFRPHFLLLYHAMQTLLYCIIEVLAQRFKYEKFDDEFIKCPDGGTVGVAWAYDKDGGRPTGKRG